MRRVSSRWHQLVFLLICSLIQVKAEVLPNTVEKTLVQDAISKGAVCLDGSPAAYHYDKGFGDGVNNWVVWLEGGGWCRSVEDCGHRLSYSNGSSNHMPNTRNFSGLLSNKKTYNPEFYNWHRIMIRYCDGSSYTGDVEAVDKNSSKMLPSSCTSRMSPALCFFPQNLQQYIKTPLFILNSAYDSFQIPETVIPFADRADFVKHCKPDFNKCSSDQKNMLRDFGAEFVSALPKSYSPSQRGMFINSCFIHCQTDYAFTWNSPVVLLNNKTIAKTFGDWFFERDLTRETVKPQDLPQICRPLPQKAQAQGH
ncbi:hypothetical protein RND71_013858 [Anisodus tanguticus]|uniref:Pectin acetylesterase n=1 Tax=Anisodus tanguticus TaxID=243964 RepID=A0AAE1VDP1_9SOLA|nr:hypothetical protein RND71_013858 [Anisodus tanguticus]